MLKLMICIVSTTLLGAILLQLRQQHLELGFQNNRLHDQIERSQAKLWSQQLQIAICTAPNAISETVGKRDLKLVPQTPLPAQQSNWIDPASDPSAE